VVAFNLTGRLLNMTIKPLQKKDNCLHHYSKCDPLAFDKYLQILTVLNFFFTPKVA